MAFHACLPGSGGNTILIYRRKIVSEDVVDGGQNAVAAGKLCLDHVFMSLSALFFFHFVCVLCFYITGTFFISDYPASFLHKEADEYPVFC